METLEKILGNELFVKIQAKLGDKNLIIDDGMLIPKHRFDCINNNLREVKKLVSDLQDENARLKVNISKLEILENELKQLKSERTIFEIVLQHKPKNYFAVRPLLNIHLSTGQRLETMVKKQITAIKQTDPYLFYECEQTYRLVPIDQSS